MALVWLSYDLGLRGDYDDLYAWLDEHSAKECGDSLAVLDFDGSIDDLKKSLKADVEFGRHARVYVVYQIERVYKGRFIIGSRKRAPWEGYSGAEEEEPDEG